MARSTNARRSACPLSSAADAAFLALINDVLDLSRLDSGRLELNLTEFSVYMLCQHSVQMVKEMALLKHQALRIKTSPSTMQMVDDYRRIQQILVNLLGNAVKFTPDGGRIELSAEGDATACTLTISVRDTGIGIAEADGDVLFQPFVQLDSSIDREYTGAGLRLALVRAWPRPTAGQPALQSTLGHGSRFYVTLPWQPVQGAQCAGSRRTRCLRRRPRPPRRPPSCSPMTTRRRRSCRRLSACPRLQRDRRRRRRSRPAPVRDHPA